MQVLYYRRREKDMRPLTVICDERNRCSGREPAFPQGHIGFRVYKAGDTALPDMLPGLEIPLEPVFAG
jgi:hypothetical protein